MRRRKLERFKEKVGIVFFIIVALLAIGYVALLIYDMFTGYEIPK